MQMSEITICLRNFRNMKMCLNEVSYDFNLVASYFYAFAQACLRAA